MSNEEEDFQEIIQKLPKSEHATFILEVIAKNLSLIHDELRQIKRLFILN